MTDFRDIEEDCTIERVKAALDGDTTTVRIDDAMRRATPLVESGRLSPIAFVLLGTIYRGHADGKGLADQKAEYVRLYNGSSKMSEKWDRAIVQLRTNDLLPAGLAD